MRDILDDLDRWQSEGKRFALATVVETWGSAPRREGAKMAISEAGEIAGSVSGGCVESAVAQVGMEVLQSGRPRLVNYGVSNETAWEVGLACGGSLEVFVERVEAEDYQFLRELLLDERPAVVLSVLDGPETEIGARLTFDASNPQRRLGALGNGEVSRVSDEPGVRELTLADAPAKVFVDIIPPSPTLVIIGGAHISIALVELADTMGYRTVVIDPRKAFATEERFPSATHLMLMWPEAAFEQMPLTGSSAVVALTHDPKIDEPALAHALRSPAFYVGALGSSRTQQRRRERLAERGLTEHELSRLHGPVGLDIGARGPEEIALSIMAEVVAARNEPN